MNYPDEMQQLIDRYQLLPHPEGGFYREIFRSSLPIVSPSVRETRSAATHIYFLLLKGQVSRFHSVAHDEIWNFYQGAPLTLLRYSGGRVSRTQIGPGCSDYAMVVDAGVHQAAETTGEYSLVGCTVAPGFDFKDFSFLADNETAEEDFRNNHTEYLRFL